MTINERELALKEIVKYDLTPTINAIEPIIKLCIQTYNQFNKDNKSLRFEFHVHVNKEVYLHDKETNINICVDKLRFFTIESATTKLGLLTTPYFKRVLLLAYSKAVN